MNLTDEHLRAAEEGEAVRLQIHGKTYYLVSEKKFENLDDFDASPMTVEEMDLLAAETVDMLEGDGLDEPLES